MMRRLAAALLLLWPLAAVAATNLATAPIDRNDLPWWRAQFAYTLAEAKARPDARVIWLGDSITENWVRPGPLAWNNYLPVWQKYYGSYHALDFGFRGDTTANLIWRLDNGQVAGLHPQVAIILIGANNLGRVHWGAEMTVPGIEAVVTNTQKRLPAAHILLLGVLPSIRSAWVDQQTAAINTALAADYAHSPVVTFINVNQVLMTKQGQTDPDLFEDPKMTPPRVALHPDAEGMARIAEFIQPAVQHYAH
jgi:lysophospholipase L1-like esterase